MVINAAIFWAKLKNIPLITSYHTNLVEYGKSYVGSWIGIPNTIALAHFLLHQSLSPADYILVNGTIIRSIEFDTLCLLI